MLSRAGGAEVQRIDLEYAGETSQFRGVVTAQESGAHEVLVYAYHPASGNTGLDRTTVIVQ